MTDSTEQTIIIVAERQVGPWTADVAMLSQDHGACVRLWRDGKVDQRLAFDDRDLPHVLAAMQLAYVRLDERLELLNDGMAAIDRRPLPETGTSIFTMATVNDAGTVMGVTWQLGDLRNGWLEAAGGEGDNIFVMREHVADLAQLARIAMGEIKAGAGMARLMAGPAAGSA